MLVTQGGADGAIAASDRPRVSGPHRGPAPHTVTALPGRLRPRISV